MKSDQELFISLLIVVDKNRLIVDRTHNK